MLEKNGYFIYTNVGYSMMPLLRPRRDLIEIRKLSGRAAKYDVVLYRRAREKSGHYVLHRVLKVLPDGKYIIAGDHNTFKEYDVTDEMILGVMTRVIRGGKSIYPNELKYRLYIHLWCDFFPIRTAILRGKGLIWKLYGKMKKKIGNNPSSLLM